MKNFEEMNVTEMMETDGGFAVAFGLTIAVIGTYHYYKYVLNK